MAEKPPGSSHSVSTARSPTQSGFRPALRSHRMFFSSPFALFWADLQQPVQFPVVGKWLRFFFSFFLCVCLDSVWIRSASSPTALTLL